MRSFLSFTCLVALTLAAACGGDDDGTTDHPDAAAAHVDAAVPDAVPPECLVPTDCADPGNECLARTCTDGVCGTSAVASGTPLAAQTAGDCMVATCDGAGATTAANDDNDTPAPDGTGCTSEVCTAGVPSHPALPAGTACGVDLFCNGAGACTGCTLASDCPGTDTECHTRTCDAGHHCGVAFTAIDTPLAVQLTGDCKQAVCDGAGGTTTKPLDTDTPADDGNECTTQTCTGDVPTFPPVAQGTTCTMGGSVCDAAGACVACLVAADCSGVDGQCNVRACTAAHTCARANQPDGTVCTEGGGAFCGFGSCRTTDFVVSRVGDGAAALNSASTALFVERRGGDGSLLGTFPLPVADTLPQSACTISGSATSEGGISLSADGKFVTGACYGTAPGLAAVGGTDSATVNRVAWRFAANSTLDTSTRLNAAFSANNVRGATSDDGSRFWVTGNGSGTTGGAWFIALGTTGGEQVCAPPNNLRLVAIFGGQLFVSSGAAGSTNVGSCVGLPTAGPAAAATALPGMPTTLASPYGFALLDREAAVAGFDTLYVADDRATANGGGVQKWTFDGTTWTLAATYNLGITSGTRGLAAMVQGTDVVVLAVTAENPSRVVKFVDDGGPLPPTATPLATAGTNTQFRGVAFAPQ